MKHARAWHRRASSPSTEPATVAFASGVHRTHVARPLRLRRFPANVCNTVGRTCVKGVERDTAIIGESHPGHHCAKFEERDSSLFGFGLRDRHRDIFNFEREFFSRRLICVTSLNSIYNRTKVISRIKFILKNLY